MKHALALALLGLLALVACASHDLGQDCRTLGSTSECSNGTICSPSVVNQLVCSKTCHVYTDCAPREDCAPVSGTSSAACKAR